ncbi:hypothetical protein PIB30_076979 [Stylosanthes scabra]|uniref:Uncharacterized protein n=1 Tax=Stylosanthes scabra TaxID=79078 RepID=A0ABU6XRD7_9FABA|nr:hypothetical protein [Stylosanthes scabra]
MLRANGLTKLEPTRKHDKSRKKRKTFTDSIATSTSLEHCFGILFSTRRSFKHLWSVGGRRLIRSISRGPRDMVEQYLGARPPVQGNAPNPKEAFAISMSDLECDSPRVRDLINTIVGEDTKISTQGKILKLGYFEWSGLFVGDQDTVRCQIQVLLL